MTAKDLFGMRVRIGDRIGILQGLPPGGAVIWDEEASRVVRLEDVKHASITDARFSCGKCGKRCNAVFSDTRLKVENLCAACFRPVAQANQVKPTCEECGAVGGAVRNPRRGVADSRVLCRACHVKAGSVVIVPGAFVRESVPLNIHERAVCVASLVAGVAQCEGSVKPRQPTGEHLCNAHAGRRRLGEKR